MLLRSLTCFARRFGLAKHPDMTLKALNGASPCLAVFGLGQVGSHLDTGLVTTRQRLAIFLAQISTLFHTCTSIYPHLHRNFTHLVFSNSSAHRCVLHCKYAHLTCFCPPFIYWEKHTDVPWTPCREVERALDFDVERSSGGAWVKNGETWEGRIGRRRGDGVCQSAS